MNTENRKEYYRNYYLNNKDKISEYNKSWQKENREKVNEYRQNAKERLTEWRKEYLHKNPEQSLLEEARKRAKLKNLPFDIDVSDIVIPDLCPVLLTPLERNRKVAKDNSPSLDRIKPELGYTKGNIQVISKKANTMKSNATEKELMLFAKWIEETYGKPS